MANSCQERVALVTGASRGIGRAIALRLAAEGAAVAVTARTLDRRTFGRSLSDTVGELRALDTDPVAVAVDLADRRFDADELVGLVESRLGPIDILVNNAAGGVAKPFGDLSDEELDYWQQLNVWSPWQLTRSVLSPMRSRLGGWILNISSRAALVDPGPPFDASRSTRWGALYGGSKAMLNRWSLSLAAELHHEGSGIAVNTLAPNSGSATEEIQAKIANGDFPPERVEPLELMAEAALALCTADPATLTGRNAYSLDLLIEMGRPVYDLTGRHLVEGWQPEDLPRRIAAINAVALPGHLLGARPSR
jgi:NAD(P)-dependent dehydrogenase (short-subunit alcohol dehydrogenase family)